MSSQSELSTNPFPTPKGIRKICFDFMEEFSCEKSKILGLLRFNLSHFQLHVGMEMMAEQNWPGMLGQKQGEPVTHPAGHGKEFPAGKLPWMELLSPIQSWWNPPPARGAHKTRGD